MWRKGLIAVAMMLALTGGMVLWLPAFLWPNRVTIRNVSGHEMRDVRLVLHDRAGNRTLIKELRHLSPGASAVLRHDLNDLRGELRFVLAGEERQFDEPTIDLWRGEGYVFEVLPDGSVTAGYDYPRSK